MVHKSDSPDIKTALHQRLLLSAMSFYALFIIYASLYPGRPWQASHESPLHLILFSWINNIELFDVIQNIIFYMPLGACLGAYVNRNFKTGLIAVSIIGILSSLLETLQCYLPMRHPSLLDITLNIAGGIIGFIVLGGKLDSHLKIVLSKLQSLNIKSYLLIGTIMGFTLSQWYPFLPTLRKSHYFNLLKYFLTPIDTPSLFQPLILIKYYAWATFTLIAFHSIFKNSAAFKIWAEWIALLIIIKMTIYGRVISFESICGIFLASITYIIFLNHHNMPAKK